MESDCIFCRPVESRVGAQSKFAYILRDGYPVTEHHTLVIPKRHAVDWFALTSEEVSDIDSLLRQEAGRLQALDPSIEGFNIGMNCGAVAGQTIFHCHVHLIPRRKGDVENPRGGVRHLIPGKGNY